MNKGKVELKEFTNSKDSQAFWYSVEHNNGATSVEQSLKISSIDGVFNPTWVASLALDDFPPQDTPLEAAHKMADWLERLASAIRVGDYLTVQRAEFKDIESE